MIPYTVHARAQIQGLYKHYLKRKRYEAHVNLTKALRAARARIESNPQSGEPYPSKYHALAPRRYTKVLKSNGLGSHSSAVSWQWIIAVHSRPRRNTSPELASKPLGISRVHLRVIRATFSFGRIFEFKFFSNYHFNVRNLSIR